MAEPKKMDLKSMDITEDKKEQLRQLFPEVFTEKKIDLEKLKLALGEMTETGKERYGLNWTGKADCFKIIQQPSVGTLKPCREESINFDDTENIFIEGDNLEVLKLLQKAYYGRVTMICIDPPYNTGNDFIYPDDYSESLDTYLKYTGQIDSEGRKYSTNTEADGRFHSKWINMIYPRLYLSRNLLHKNGVIFIHINDKEVDNLKKICNEIFGEENFIAQLVWDRGHSAQAGIFKVYHEYVMVYARASENIKTPEVSGKDIFHAGAMKKESKRHPMQNFVFPKGTRIEAPHGTEFKDEWGDIEKVILLKGKMLSDNNRLAEDVELRGAWTQMNQMKQFFYGDRNNLYDSRGQKIVEFYFSSTGKIKVSKERAVFTPPTTLKDYGSQGAISTALANLFGIEETPIDNPKSHLMIKDFVKWFSDYEEDCLILDFFSGSCTTAHAVLEQNSEDGGNRKFICIQLPEPCNDKSVAFKTGYKTIADIGKERIRRVIKKIKEEKEGKIDYDESKQDFGFKVLKLDKSNFKIWEAETAENVEKFKEQLELHVDHIDPKSTQEDILYELLLKAGFDLATKIEKLSIADKTVYSIADGAMLICLEEKLTKEVINAMAEMKPSRVICLDKGFKDNDQLKANAVQIMKSKKVNTFLTV